MVDESALDLLHRVFGFHQFRGHQAEVIGHLSAGGHALVLMPTGAGKSLCYQIPALMRPGTGLVVSPLIALMQDQVAAMQQYGIRAAYLNSTLDWPSQQRIEQSLVRGTLDLLYVAPERLLKPRMLDLLSRSKLALIAIDEAHCVSQWGHDFRPDYLQIATLFEHFPDVPRLALTATADIPTRREIIEKLHLSDARLFVSSFDRPNICYTVAQKDRPRDQVTAFLKDHAGDAGIIYCLSRRKVDETAAWLQAEGWDALPYHAGLTADQRKQNQQRFLREEGVVMVATIAFGMGIDKSNVRFVAHLDLPRSLEAYYQETGRAGRDGLPAHAWMIYGLQDVVALRQMLESSDSEPARKKIEHHKLESMLAYCEATRCRRRILLNYFGDALDEACGNCDICTSSRDVFDATTYARQALSCIYRTGQRFGVSYVIDVLRGVDESRIREAGHQLLHVFGIGKELSVTQWRTLLRQLVARGFVTVDVDGHGGLQLTESARPLLRGEQVFFSHKEASPAKKKSGDVQKDKETARGGLFEGLRQRRKQISEEQGVAPYVIFSDAVLQEMSQAKPKNLRQFAGITGVGARKLELYGNEFLAVIKAFSKK